MADAASKSTKTNTLESSVLEFVNKIDPARHQEFIAGQNPNLNLYKDWYNGQNSWHSRKQLKGGKVQLVNLEASGTPKLIAEDWASNYANEDTLITIASPKDEKTTKVGKNEENKDNTADAIVNNILKKEGFFGKFNSFTEEFMALGCGAIVVMPDKFLFDENNKLKKDPKAKVKIKFLNAERVVPITIDDGEVTECAFVRVTTRETIVQVHILIDDEYVIGEVRGANTEAGVIPNFKYDEAKIIRTGSNISLFYIWHPNIKGKEMLESIYQQAIGWFKLVDTIFDCWTKEFERGKKKRFISAELRQIGSDGKVINTEDFLDDEDVQVPLSDDGKTFINEFNAELRVDPILKALVSAMNIAARLCGLGDSSFEIGENGGRPIQTATAAILKETKLYKNIIKQENFATNGIKKMLLAIKEVYNRYISNTPIEFEEDDIQIVYDDNIMEDTDSKRKNDLAEVNAGVMTIAEYRSHWYDEDYESAVKFVQENGMLLDKFILALQSHVITPEIFVKLVFGENVEGKDKLLKYIEENYSNQPEEKTTGFEDETEEDKENGAGADE